MTAATTTPTTAEQHRYRFAATDGRLWLGLGPLPIAALGCALVFTVALLYVGAPLPVTVLFAAVGVIAAVLPIAGRPLTGWLPPVTRQATGEAAGLTRWAPAVLHPQPHP